MDSATLDGLTQRLDRLEDVVKGGSWRDQDAITLVLDYLFF